MDAPHDRETGDASPSMTDEARLLALMAASERDTAAGLTVPLADVLADLDRIATEIEARHRIPIA